MIHLLEKKGPFLGDFRGHSFSDNEESGLVHVVMAIGPERFIVKSFEAVYLLYRGDEILPMLYGDCNTP